MKLLKNKKGFTLVELIIVIAIIGILAAVTVPAMIGVVDKANASNAGQALDNQSKLLTEYITDSAVAGQDIQDFVSSLKGAEGVWQDLKFASVDKETVGVAFKTEQVRNGAKIIFVEVGEDNSVLRIVGGVSLTKDMKVSNANKNAYGSFGKNIAVQVNEASTAVLYEIKGGSL